MVRRISLGGCDGRGSRGRLWGLVAGVAGTAARTLSERTEASVTNGLTASCPLRSEQSWLGLHFARAQTQFGSTGLSTGCMGSPWEPFGASRS